MKKNWKKVFLLGLTALIPLTYAVAEESLPLPKEERTAQASLPLPINRINDHISAIRTFLQENAQNHSDVLIEYDNLAKTLKNSYLADNTINEGDVHIILDAVGYAAEKHKGQIKNQAPYILHPLRVAEHLLNLANINERDILVAALLHDTVEDMKTTYQDIQKTFGAKVEGYVKEVTEDLTLNQQERKDQMLATAAKKSKGAALIKLAEKYDNLKNLQNTASQEMDQKAIDEYFQTSKEIVNQLPNANDTLKKAVSELISQHKKN